MGTGHISTFPLLFSNVLKDSWTSVVLKYVYPYIFTAIIIAVANSFRHNISVLNTSVLIHLNLCFNGVICRTPWLGWCANFVGTGSLTAVIEGYEAPCDRETSLRPIIPATIKSKQTIFIISRDSPSSTHTLPICTKQPGALFLPDHRLSETVNQPATTGLELESRWLIATRESLKESVPPQEGAILPMIKVHMVNSLRTTN